MNTQQQAYIEGFVKRANDYGFSDAEAVTILKQAFLGEPAYKEKRELDEEELKGMSFKDVQKYLTPEEGEGVMAHLKRNPGKYLGGSLGALMLGGLADAAGEDPTKAIVLGGGAGAAVGALPDAVLNLLRRGVKQHDAYRHLGNLQNHISTNKKLNSDASIIYNQHSLGL